MRQSRKEQSIERGARSLLHLGPREAAAMSCLEGDVEAAEEWAAGFKVYPSRKHGGR
ncbi:hypothetical protein [Paenibacillus arenilitoris]|uniref:Uncharacterized protein n=1 Tax=Paenibacillus arenilitoris TaxID=2772299 RepID=A0A927CPH8_9BACL|nr:hypothetical protein [Paenibacillus arenilitoris]MBD2870413.1 hypothetical protein [Paenibacillus arenilitoris]